MSWALNLSSLLNRRHKALDSMYAKYLKERTNDHIIENSFGFATYRYLDESTVYIIDIYVGEKIRKSGHATQMADKIAEEAKLKGCTKMLGTVIPSTKNSTLSMHVLLGYGMTLQSADKDLIVFKKDL